MSIYATLWDLQFPADRDDFHWDRWATVRTQGVPSHIGSPTEGCTFEDGDPYAAFLPPAVAYDRNVSRLRAVVFVICGSKKVTNRSGQMYVSPLLVMAGDEYMAMPFPRLHRLLCEALRVEGPNVVMQTVDGLETLTAMRSNGSPVAAVGDLPDHPNDAHGERLPTDHG